MKPNFKHISELPVNMTAAAKLISSFEGQTLARQSLQEYVARHGLPTTQPKKRTLINPRMVAEHRHNFTRETMRGEHLQSETPKPAAVPNVVPVSTVNAARDAKTRALESQAEREELKLAKEKSELADVKAAIGCGVAAMASAKSHLLGPALSKMKDEILAGANLPETFTRDLEKICKTAMRSSLSSMSATFLDDFGRLNSPIGKQLPTRLDLITAYAVKTLESENSDLQSEARALA